MAFLSDYLTRFSIVGDRTASAEQRVFACLELFCMPVSFLTLGLLVATPIARCFGVSFPGWFENQLLPVLMSAAVGYLTNWIAIEMLFKPYRKTWRHLFPIMTCGYWRQGLVPKNKDRIADIMGEQVATRLLQPEKLADDLCSMVGGVLQNPTVLGSIQTSLQRQIALHDKAIIDFLAPRIEAALISEIDRLVTAENIQAFWSDQIQPYLQSEETREKIARMLIAAIKRNSPMIASKIRPWIVKTIEEYCHNNLGVASVVLAPLAGALADFFLSQKTIEKGLVDWLKRPETMILLRDELAHYVQELRNYLESPEAKESVGEFVQDIRSRFKQYLRTYLHDNLANTAGTLLRSEELWEWVSSLIPEFQPELEKLIREQGMPLIIDKMDIQGRIKLAVDKMDMEEFHGMINEVAAQHLGAIQVLGYLLGALAGALMLAAK